MKKILMAVLLSCCLGYFNVGVANPASSNPIEKASSAEKVISSTPIITEKPNPFLPASFQIPKFKFTRGLKVNPGGPSSYFFFGDSLTDMGNYVAGNTQPCVDVSAPVTNPSGTGLYGGQLYSNEVIPQFQEGFRSSPSPFFSSGNNFAIAGSTATLNPYSLHPDSYVFASPDGGIDGQLGTYFENNPPVQPNQNNMFVLWIGANDILDTFAAGGDVADNLNTVVTNSMLAIQEYTQNLFFNRNARQFLFIALPDLSKTPLAAAPFFNPQLPILVGAFNRTVNGVNIPNALQQATSAWNEQLLTLVVQMANYYYSIDPVNTQFYFYDPNTALNTILADPLNGSIDGIPYNFTHTNQDVWCDPVGTNPANPDNFMFFNYIHPSAQLQQLLTADIVSTAMFIR